MTATTAREAWKAYSSFRRANKSSLGRTARHAAVPAPSMDADRIVWPHIERAFERGSLRLDALAARQPGEYTNKAWW